MHLEPDRTALVVVDVQERLFPHVHDHTDLERELIRLARGTRELGLPTVVTEQYVKGLGSTIATLRDALGEAYEPLEKMSFSCCGDNRFLDALVATGRSDVILCGIEAHVCVYQTATDLLDRGYRVHLVTDAVSSRTRANRDLALRRLEAAGVILTGVEMLLFELLGVSGTPEFKAISRLVK
jgi:nicotinamidase-related amidase